VFDHTLLEMVLSSVNHNLIYSICLQNLMTLDLAVPQIWLVPTKI